MGKQRIECYTILQILLGKSKSKNGKIAWKNHPAVKMWQGFPTALALYGYIVCLEWRKRGYKDSYLEKFRNYIFEYNNLYTDILYPKWMGDENFHSAHRASLLYKNFEYYKKFNWNEIPIIDYIWPVK